MPQVEPSAISGMAGAVPTNVAVTTDGKLLTSGSTSSAGAIQLSTSSMNPVTLAASTALNTVAVSASTTATLTTVAATTAVATTMLSSTAGSATATGRKGLIAYSCSGSAAPALVAYSTAASSTVFSFVVIPGQLWEMPVPLFLGGLSVATSTASGAGGTATLLVTELT